MISLTAGVGFLSGALLQHRLAPYIGCDFSDRVEAREQRDAGVLPRDAVYEACKRAVDNFFDKRLISNEGKVIVYLPSRAKVGAGKNVRWSEPAP